MKHMGDITKINGADVPPVDVVIGGSPCQDLSIAGKRAGLAGARSGLYMEQIRVIREMREHDRRMGRTGEFIRPRYMVWENVPGAFSSNGGRDFAAVLEEVIRIAEPEAPDIEVPEKGWNTWGGYHDEVGGRWSVAWRVLDAQHWGVPQRRRRIALVADFGGDTAGEISFERRSLPGNPAESGAAGEGTAGAAENGDDCAIPINDKATRYAGGGPTRNHDGAGNGLGVGRNGHQPSILDMSHACDVIRDCGEVSPSLQARMGTGGNQIPLTYQQQQFGDYRAADVASSCKRRDFKSATDLVCSSVDCRNFTEGGEINGALQAKESGGQSLNLNNVCRQNMVVRRLTPLECERLQGYPDGWTDIGDWVESNGKKHKAADSPRYKALGNSIALPPWKWLLKRISAQYTRNATMASLFDGIGGFPLIWEQLNGQGSCLWASEIEEFPMAVTRRRFGNPKTGEIGDMGRFLFPCGGVNQ